MVCLDRFLDTMQPIRFPFSLLPPIASETGVDLTADTKPTKPAIKSSTLPRTSSQGKNVTHKP